MRRTRTTLVVATLAVTATLGITAATAIPGSPAKVPVGFTDDRSADLAGQIDPAKPRNVILIIGDGMDDSIITAARNYAYGAAGRLPALDELPFTGAMTTYGLKTGPGPDYPIAYVSDSAPTASGWSTGKKTVDGRLSQGPSSASAVPGENYDTVLENYQLAGKRVGNISTAEITDATPAAAASHISQRACQGPTDMTPCAVEKKAVGGLGSVAEQLVDHKIDVLMGGGKARFAQATDAGPTVLQDADTLGYGLVEDEAAMNAVTSLDKGPVLGLFTSGNMTPRFSPLVATGAGAGGATTTCATADRGTQPTLAEMTAKSIELLDNPQGFFLQAESAMVDKQEHAADICGAIGDVLELDAAVQVALDYQAENPDTLIIATADHGHSTQIVGSSTGGKATATVQTVDGDPMTVAYSTADLPGSQGHTGTQVRVAASGPQAANVTGTIDQTDLFLTLSGRTPSTLPTGPSTPAPPVKPSVKVAARPSVRRSALSKPGLPISVAAAGAGTVTMTVRNRGKVLLSKTLPARGTTAWFKTRRKITGTLVIRVVATGRGGTATDTRTVRTTR